MHRSVVSSRSSRQVVLSFFHPPYCDSASADPGAEDDHAAHYVPSVSSQIPSRHGAGLLQIKCTLFFLQSLVRHTGPIMQGGISPKVQAAVHIIGER